MAAWKRRSDMRKVCGNIFEDRKRLNLNVHQRFSQIFRLYDIYIGIYAESFKKQKEKNKVFAHLHYIRLAMLHIRVICFQHMVAWKRCSDMRKVCGNIFEDRKKRNVQLNLNVHQRFSQIFWLYDEIYIGI